MVSMFMRRDPKVVKGYSLDLNEFNDFMLFYNGVKEAFDGFTGAGTITLSDNSSSLYFTSFPFPFVFSSSVLSSSFRISSSGAS